MDGTPGVAVASKKPRNRNVTLLAMCIGVLVAQLDTSVVNIAIKHIGYDFNIGISTLQWVIDAYNVTYASLVLTGGALGDLFGRRRLFAAGMAVFILGSLACGLAPDASSLIAGRAVTGLGAALMLPTSLSILAVAYPDSGERGRAIGVWASCNGLAFALGPTLGGWIMEVWGWRDIFFLIIPVAAVALVLALARVPESSNPEGRRLDLPGQGLAILFLGALTYGAIEGPRWGWMTQATALCATISIISFAMFLLHERRTPGALAPLDLFRHRGLSASVCVAAAMTFGMYALLFLAPLYLQTMRGASTLLTGIELLPMSLTFLFVSRYSGPLVVRCGPRSVMAAGMCLMGIGLLMMASVNATSGLWLIEGALLIVGIGLGLNTGPVVAVAVASVPRERSGTASGIANAARMVGATLGVAILGTVFASYGGHRGVVDHMVEGLRASFLVGAGGELFGALVAVLFIPSTQSKP